jgi:ATP-dependent Lon protease
MNTKEIVEMVAMVEGLKEKLKVQEEISGRLKDQIDKERAEHCEYKKVMYIKMHLTERKCEHCGEQMIADSHSLGTLHTHCITASCKMAGVCADCDEGE